MGTAAAIQNPRLSDRALVEHAARLHWLHWLVVVMSLVITFAAWYMTKRQVDGKIEEQFERQTALVIGLVSERMQKYEDGLWGGVSTIQVLGGEMTHLQWRAFAKSLRIELKYPGINGIGVIHSVSPDRFQDYLRQQRQGRPDYRVFPQHEQSEYLPISYVEPAAPNAQAIGLDIAHEANRYQAAQQARDTGKAQITGPIVLVQDEAQTPGFLFYAPYYRGGIYSTIEQRRAHFLGMVYAPFVVSKLMAGTLDRDQRQVVVRIRDGDQVLYDEYGQKPADSSLAKSVDLNLYGRAWSFDVAASTDFLAAHANAQPLVILFGGITIDALLLGLFIILSNSNRKALRFADRMTAQLKARTAALERSNAELDKFAYVASHDLRAPLRAVSQLADIVIEDNEELLSEQSREDLKLLKGRVTRMDELLSGLLQYARIGLDESMSSEIDLAELVENVTHMMDSTDRLEVEVDAGTIYAPRVAVELIFRNLIGNTIKHHDRPHGHIRIRYESDSEYITIIYSDDGPGIEFEFRDRIFEMFQTLQSRDDVEGGGMGLALIKKTVEAHGGSIELCQTEGRGAVFRLAWPRHSRLQENAA